MGRAFRLHASIDCLREYAVLHTESTDFVSYICIYIHIACMFILLRIVVSFIGTGV